MARHLIENRLTSFDTCRLGWKTVVETMHGMAHADIVKACEDAAKDAVLDERRQIRTSDLKEALKRRRKPGGLESEWNPPHLPLRQELASQATLPVE